MFNQIKTALKRFPFLVRSYETVVRLSRTIINELRDIRDSYLSKTPKAVVTPYGFTLQGSSSMHHHNMQKGTFEEDETVIMQQHFHRSDIFVDVGANIGFYSCLARSMGKHVIAVEPLSRNLTHLYANLLNNSWDDVEVFPVGLSDRPGLAVLYGASSTGASLIGNWAGASKRFKRIISLSMLDVLLGDRFIGKKLFIKIDVEGAEYAVLMGAVRTLKRIPKPTWILEICLNEFHPSGANPNYLSTFELFWQHGYEARTADRQQRLVRRDDVQQWINEGFCKSDVINYIFIPTTP